MQADPKTSDTNSAGHLTLSELMAGLDHVAAAPRDNGVLKLIVQRPAVNERQSVTEGRLDTVQGLVGDTWLSRGSSRSPGAPPRPETQITIMNARAAALIARDPERWQLAGDQLFIDLDLSGENLPPRTRLAIGAAIIEITAEAHTGCKKFAGRFGHDALKFVNLDEGRRLNLRGIYARVVQSGDIRVGDTVRKLQ